MCQWYSPSNYSMHIGTDYGIHEMTSTKTNNTNSKIVVGGRK
jgi:hypothetical protein